ncbi:MAG: hypothetical protein WA876_11230 [Candidatus Acidiferrales bacterium]
MAFASLGRDAREVADEMDAIIERIDHSGALAKIREHAAANRIPLPQVSVTEAARALRVYAGLLFQISGKLARR